MTSSSSSSSNSDILKCWLQNLRFTIEYYEDFEFDAQKNSDEKNMMIISEKMSMDDDDSYVNIWDCSNNNSNKDKVKVSESLKSISEEVSSSLIPTRVNSEEGRRIIRKKPIAAPRKRKKITEEISDEAIYANLPLIVEPSSEAIYENLPLHRKYPSTDSLKLEEDVFQTLHYLDNIIGTTASAYSDDSEFELEPMISLSMEKVNDKKFSDSTSSFGEYFSREKLLSSGAESREKKKRFFKEELEEDEPSMQEVKIIPITNNKKEKIYDEKHRFSLPLIIDETEPKITVIAKPKSFDNNNDNKKQSAINNNYAEIKLRLNFAQEFNLDESFEQVDDLDILIDSCNAESFFILQNDKFLENLKEDVVCWIGLLMDNFCGEFDNIMEQQELLKSINEVPNNNNKGQTRTENKFPPYDVDYDVDVECRNKPEIRRNRLSKTTDFDVGRKKIARPVNPKNFDIRGIIKLQVSTSDKADLIKCKDEYLTYENDNFYRINLKTKSKSELYSNVIIKSVRYQKSNKDCKEIELKDIKNVIYILHFEDWKRAKQFMENEKIQVYIPDNKVTLMQTLRKLLGRRESQDSLEKRGIYKNEPIFGNTLKNIRNATNCLVPIFITEIIKHLEKPENIKNLGLYRTSGNLAIIQKIRFEVDNGKLTILDQYSKDPDVLTGSLKLFFRELKEPLISRDICDNLLEFTKINPKDISSRDRQRIKDTLVENMDKSNLETLVVIIKHLIEVVKYKEFNKMDSYNLAICWGPSLIFSIAKNDTTSPIELSKDIVSLSQDATRLVDFFLTYYEQHPAELDALRKRPRIESISDKMQTLKRQDSRDSDWSMDSFRSQKTSTSSNLSLSVDEVVRKLIEFIELHIGVVEDLYRKSGSADKTSKILKKLNKKKLHELDKYKYEAYELTDALKKYLRDQSECLIGDRTVESVLAIAPDNLDNCLESANRRQIIARIEDTPKKDTLIFLLRHIAKVLAYQENNFNLPREKLLTLWSTALINPKKMKISNENFTKFLTVAVKVFDDNLPDIVKSSFSNKTSNRSESMDELMKEMKFQHNKQAEMDRNSRYDNVDSDIGEATILEDDKTEETKL